MLCAILLKKDEKIQMNEEKIFLQLLIDCQHQNRIIKMNDERNQNENDAESHYMASNENANHNYYKQSNNEPLSDDEVIAQAFIFFLASFQTTTSTLSYCCYELALNQQIQNKLY